MKFQHKQHQQPGRPARGRVAMFTLLSLFTILFTAGAQAPDRSAPPSLGPPPTLSLSPVQKMKLSNGLQVVFMEKHEVPLLHMIVLVKAGSAMDPEDKNGLASMTAAMLDEGAGTRDALELADAIDYLGARISVSASFHATSISLHTPVSKADSALGLLADVVIRPTFPAKELERLRKERLTTLVQWRDEPRAIASVLFNRVLYGTGHPYGLSQMGDEKTLRSFTVSDLQRFHRTYFHPNNTVIVVAGDVTETTLKKKLEAQFGSWNGRTVVATNWPSLQPIGQRRVYLVDKPGAAQSEIRIGNISVDRGTPDYFPIEVLNTILGGSFTSRLNQNLREEHGYTYGAGSIFDMRPLPGPFLAASAVQTEVTKEALTEFMKELNGIRQPIPPEEADRARNYVALGYLDNFQSVGSVANQLSDLVEYGLKDSFFNDFIGNVSGVTDQDLQMVARKYVDPAHMAVVVVGDRAKIEKGIRELNLGPVEVLSITDVLGEAPRL